MVNNIKSKMEVNYVENFIQNLRNENDNKRKLICELFSSNDENQNINLQLNYKEIEEIIDRLKTVFSLEKSPIQVLHELFPGMNSVVKIIDKGSYGQAHEPIHVTCITIDKIGSFSGKAKSKQESKQKAGQIVISFLQQFMSLFDENKNKRRKNKRNYYQDLVLEQKTDSAECDNDENNVTNSDPLKFLQTPDLSKIIVEKVLEKWSNIVNPNSLNQLIEKTILVDNNTKTNFIEQDLWRYKELASFVLISDIDGSVQVLSIGTGTKCISGQNMSLCGDVVNDSHAEVIARRGLLHVLYDNLELLLSNNLIDKPEFIIEPCDTNRKRFRLKKHLKLHLFITSPPCGDARVFNFQSKLRKNPIAKGTLRCKIDKGQGTVPMPKNYISTWDGILISCQRSTFMSCSDKIALWNVVGVQGSLLSLFFEPIYIESLTVSNLFRYNHLVRALHGRINKDKLIPKLENNADYRLNECKIGFHHNSLPMSTQSNKDLAFIPFYSHNWFIKRNSKTENNNEQQQTKFNDDNDVEIIRCETGTNYFNSEISRLSKIKILERFINLITNFPNLCDEIEFIDESNNSNNNNNNNNINESNNQSFKLSIENCKDKDYHSLKHIAKNYHKAKIALFETFKESNFRTWIPSPIDLDLFSIFSPLSPSPSNSNYRELEN